MPHKDPKEHAAYVVEWYRANPDKKKQMDREQYEKNREKKIAQAQANYQANREKRLEQSKANYARQRERKKAQVARYQMLKKIEAVNVLGGCCTKCGEDHPAALQFHHRDPSTKSFTITTKQLASPKKYPWETILAEIKKCDLLCANCHFKHHCVWELP